MTADLDAVLRLAPVRDALGTLRDVDAVRRLHAGDPSLWSDDEAVRASIGRRLGWLRVADGANGWSQSVREFAQGVAADGLSRVVLAGMGGSSLAPEVFARVFAGRVSGAQLQVLDSTHPDVVTALLDDTDLAGTLVVASSKSGTTTETAAFAAHAARLVPSPDHLAAITDPGTELVAEAAGWRAVFENPPDIGGRYSALSLFGMLPAALVGVDVDEVWARAGRMRDRCGPGGETHDNPAAQLAAYMAGLAASGRDKLTLLADEDVSPLGDWIEQLVAESTGKRGTGIVPVVGEPVAPPERYGDDRAFVALRLAGRTPTGVEAIAERHPVLVLDVDERRDLGAEFLRWELATALAGAVLGVNPFDEPNVAESKDNTRAVLDEVASGEALPEPGGDDVGDLLAGMAPPDYLAVQAYLPPTADRAASLARLRALVRDRLGCATTVGWGPRFLHSTGQLHKGGPGTVVSLQVVDAPDRGPGRPSPSIPGRDHDFAALIRAQAVGDLRSLRDHGRRAAQVRADSPADLDRLVEAVAAALQPFG